MNINTRIASADDAETIARIGGISFAETYASFNTVEDIDKYLVENFTPSVIVKELIEPSNVYILAFADGEAAGYEKLILNKQPKIIMPTNNIIELSRIYSLKKYIGKGIGKSLMLASIDLGIKLKFECIWLGVWQQNPAAIAFYKKWGFEIFGTHQFVLGNDVQDDWLMKKKI